MSTPSPAAPMTTAVVAPHRWRALAALVVSLLVVVLDNTVLNVALKTIQQDLGATQSQLIWAINAYSLVFAALLFTWGVLGDRYGRRRILIIGLLLFAAASLLSAFAQTPEQLIVARALMGIGGASVLPVTLSIITVIFPPAERGKAIGIWAAAVGGAVALGPLLGGLPPRALLVGLGVPDQHPDHHHRDRRDPGERPGVAQPAPGPARPRRTGALRRGAAGPRVRHPGGRMERAGHVRLDRVRGRCPGRVPVLGVAHRPPLDGPQPVLDPLLLRPARGHVIDLRRAAPGR